jgi:hypothetical protein
MDARERKRYDVLVALSLMEEVTLDEMCECMSVPVNWWLHPDATWSAHPTTEDGAVHAEMYLRARCVGWVVGCPRCSRLFAAGLKVPSVITG